MNYNYSRQSKFLALIKILYGLNFYNYREHHIKREYD